MRLIRILAAVLAVLAAVLAYNTLRVGGRSQPVPEIELPAIDAGAAAERLAGALRIPTVTVNEPGRADWTPWPRLHEHLAASFPAVHRALQRELVGGYSLLYTWTGADPALPPVLLLAHQDVVPIEPGTESAWEQPPFGGNIADGYVWGRGALDDKASLMAQLEAVEWLLGQGFAPSRTVLFAFGHDEEIGGLQGAAAVAQLLESRGLRAEFSLDEGGALTRGVFAGVDRPVAMVATAEKGYVSFRLTARDAGGHSSRPPPVTAVGRLARAVARLEAKGFPPRLVAPVDTMLERLAPDLPLAQRLAVANLWLTRPLVARQLAAGGLTGPLVRTTTAPTQLSAGIKDNVLPTEAHAVVNFRVLPGDSIATVWAHIEQTVADGQIEVAVLDFASEPSPVADPETAAFRLLSGSVREVFPEALVVPGLVIGATDNRHYAAVAAARYNFLPVEITADDLARIHGANERIGVEAYRRAVQFYIQFLCKAAGRQDFVAGLALS